MRTCLKRFPFLVVSLSPDINDVTDKKVIISTPLSVNFKTISWQLEAI